MTAIECKDVTKKFEDTEALKQVSVKLEEGKIYALLGRNGAGKTTLMNCLCTKYLPDSGQIYILEEEAYENEKVLSQICFMSDHMEAFGMKTVKYILKFAASFYPDWDGELESRLLDFFAIKKKLSYVTLSKGQQTIIGIIIGLCSGCRVVLFDEIYSGLDAVARQDFYKILLEEQEKNPRTFLLSTHLIEEMTSIFTDVVMMDKGKIILNEDMETIYAKSYKCVGRTDQADCFSGKNVLCKKEMGAMTEYEIYDVITIPERKELEAKGFTISPLTLQELFVAFTQKGAREWGKTDGSN